jgi:hypothetical protein
MQYVMDLWIYGSMDLQTQTRIQQVYKVNDADPYLLAELQRYR